MKSFKLFIYSLLITVLLSGCVAAGLLNMDKASSASAPATSSAEVVKDIPIVEEEEEEVVQ